MSWQATAFREYFLEKVGKETSASSYAVNLRKLDVFTGGLDEKIAEVGLAGIIPWAKQQSDGPFEAYYASNVRSALNRYVKFLIDASDPEASEPEVQQETTSAEAEAEATVFQYEKELQVAVRSQLQSLQPGLSIADSGNERPVATGKIDVLATDDKGRFVVIELKAGPCKPGALEQVLGYAEDLQAETGTQTLAVLVASEFPERIRAAARRAKDLRLVTYKLQLAFEPFE